MHFFLNFTLIIVIYIIRISLKIYTVKADGVTIFVDDIADNPKVAFYGFNLYFPGKL